MQPDRVKWMLPMVSLIPEDSLQRLKRQFGADFDHFSTLEVQALVTADIEKRVDNRRLQQITGEHAADITHLLQSLVARKALVKQGHGRWSWYHLPEVESTLASQDHSLGNDDRFLGNDDRFLGNGGRILGIGDRSLGNDEKLLQIARPARLKKRISQQKMRAIILDLCEGYWLSKAQIAQFVSRNPEDLRNRYINPMVSEGKLQLRFPETPRRDDQAYRTVSVINPNSDDE